MIEKVNRERVAEKLSKAIQFKTVSHLNEDETDWNEFEKFYEFLKEAFPNI